MFALKRHMAQKQEKAIFGWCWEENEENKSIAETAGGDGAEWAAAETWLTGLNTTHNPSSLLFCHFIGFNSDSVMKKQTQNRCDGTKLKRFFFFFS